MLPTYPAILRDNRLEWSGDAPPNAGAPVRVYVTLVEPVPSPPTDQGARMAAALEKLAALNAFADITDPVAWQREQRKDRDLPGRES
jgi:hypothetical protein